MPSKTITLRTIAKCLNVPQDEISMLVRQGMPVCADGKYEREACMGWYIRHLHDQLRQGGVNPENDCDMTKRLSNRRKPH